MSSGIVIPPLLDTKTDTIRTYSNYGVSINLLEAFRDEIRSF